MGRGAAGVMPFALYAVIVSHTFVPTAAIALSAPHSAFSRKGRGTRENPHGRIRAAHLLRKDLSAG
jgi:hypothetical protein